MKTVIWDVDDVLNDLMYQWFVHEWVAKHPSSALSYSALTSNPPHEILGVERVEYLASMDIFRETERARAMLPSPEVMAWFREHGHRFRHVALTARPLKTAPDVAHWVMRHFGIWIRCFGVVPTRADPGVPVYDRSKRDYLAWLGRGDILVDDAMENLAQASSLGMRTLTFSQPWNNSVLSTSALLYQLSHMAGD